MFALSKARIWGKETTTQYQAGKEQEQVHRAKVAGRQAVEIGRDQADVGRLWDLVAFVNSFDLVLFANLKETGRFGRSVCVHLATIQRVCIEYL